MAKKRTETDAAETSRDEALSDGSYGQSPSEDGAPSEEVLVRVTLTGSSPLLCNAMPYDQLYSLWDPEGRAPTRKEKPTPRQWCASKLYTDNEGTPVVPVKNLFACLRDAGALFTLRGRKQVSTSKSTMLPGLLQITDAKLPIYKPGVGDPAEWEVDVQQGVNPNGGEGVCVIRPRFDEWEIRPTLRVFLKQVNLGLVRNLIDTAGRVIGLGDFRPQRRGIFGCFVVNAWENLPNRGPHR